MRYGIGVGREGFTWSGVKTVERKAEWPDWIPPAEMLERQPYLPRFMAGGPGNPLGARAMYLGGTIYRIHGTNQPSTIGKRVSSGCIRMVNEDVIDLYSRVNVGTKVVVLPMTAPRECRAEPPGRPGNADHQFICPGFRTGRPPGTASARAAHLLKPYTSLPLPTERRPAAMPGGVSSFGISEIRLQWSAGDFAARVTLGRKGARVTQENPFPVVGIGSSAGGVEALRSMFEHMPSDTGMAFILVSHLARDVESVLPDIVRRHTKMRVVAAADAMTIEPDTVYAAPANGILTVSGGKLVVVQRATDHQQRPIDVFLSSLADDFGEAAVGVVLSGADSDGTLGIKVIKERGGLTVAQGSDGSKPLYRQMPGAAIASGLIDIVAPVEEMGHGSPIMPRDFAPRSHHRLRRKTPMSW